MKISWVLAAQFQLPIEVDIESVKSVGPSWGSWKTWRSSGTDNVICHDRSQAEQLVTRQFQNQCNLHLPKQFYKDLGHPQNIKWYDGDYSVEVDDVEDCVALHLAAFSSDIVLLTGFELVLPKTASDKNSAKRINTKHSIIYQAVKSNSLVQWVVLDSDIDSVYKALPNVTCDKLKNVL